MDIMRLREFVALASQLKLTTAARDLFMSPSTLSQHITSLEREVGAELFTRSNGFELTERGEMVLDHAQKILFEYDALLRDCAASGHAHTVRLSIPNYHYLKRPIADARDAFLAAHPGCSVTLRTNELQNDDPFEIISDGSSDVSALYIVRGCGYTIEDRLPEGISYIKLPARRCVFISSERHPLAAKQILTTDDLNGASIVVKLCPVCFILMDGLTRVLNGYGALTRVLFRRVTRNADMLMNDLGTSYVQWFERVGEDSGGSDAQAADPDLPDLPVHRFEHELLADSYLLYRPDRLDGLQTAYLEFVGRLANGR